MMEKSVCKIWLRFHEYTCTFWKCLRETWDDFEKKGGIKIEAAEMKAEVAKEGLKGRKE